VLLLVSIAMPLSAQQTIKKELYHTNIRIGTSGVGTSTIFLSRNSPQYRAMTYTLPNNVVTRVALLKDDGSWPGEVVLCDNNTSADDCTYSDDGNLDIEGSIPGAMLPPGVSAADFINTLRGGHLMIRLNDGSLGSGVYVQIM
jgi:hypothetical protein